MAIRVVDTDVVSFLFQSSFSSNGHLVARYRAHVMGHRLLISFMSLAELDRWVLVEDWGRAKRRQLTRHLKKFGVVPHYRGLSKVWARLIEEARGNGLSFPGADAWTAAIALALGVPVITHNRRHFRGVAALQVISEAPP